MIATKFTVASKRMAEVDPKRKFGVETPMAGVDPSQSFQQAASDGQVYLRQNDRRSFWEN
jgi:hypothetical protein